MPNPDIPLSDLLALAKKGNLDARGLPATVAAEKLKATALSRKAAAAELIGILPNEVAEKLAAVPDATAAKSDPVALARTAVAEAGLAAAVAGRFLDKLDRLGKDPVPDGRADLPEFDPTENFVILEQARLAETITSVGVKEDAAKTVLARLTGPDDLGDQTIGTLVADGTLDEAEGLKVGRTISLARLLGDNSAVAAKLVDTKLSTTGKPVEDLRDLVDVPVEELAKGIAAADPKLKRTARQMADNLKGHLAETFPTRGLSFHLRTIAPASTDTDFGALAKAIKGRAEIWDGSDADPAFDDGAKRALANARVLDRTWAGLGIGKLLLDPKGAGRAAEIGKHIEAAEAFLRRNEDTNLFDLDLSADADDVKELDFTDTPDDLRPALIEHLKARSRAYHLAGDTESTARIMSAGIHTMQGVIDEGLEGLIAKAGLDRAQAERVLSAAHDRRTDVVATEPPRVYRRAKLSENCPLWNRHQGREPRSRIPQSSASARFGWRWNTAMSIRAKLRR